MNAEATLEIIRLVNNLFQLAQAANLSLSDLIKDKEDAVSEGRDWGHDDVVALITKSRAEINELERLLDEEGTDNAT
jgi:hypothetical protein